jgi:hypothetical protein
VLGGPIGNGENGAKAAPEHATGRQANGQFAKGNVGGPGNPFARRTAALRKALCEVVSEDDIRELGQQLLTLAKSGDLAAMKLLFAYVIGRPAPAVDPDTLDQQEWAHYQGVPTTPQDLQRIMHSLPAGLACTLMRSILPNQQQLMENDVVGMLKACDKRDERRAQRKAARAAAAAAPAAAEEPGVEQVVPPSQPAAVSSIQPGGREPGKEQPVRSLGESASEAGAEPEEPA